MKEAEFTRYMLRRNLADRTRAQRTLALKRIERAHELDLDEEYERDKFTSLLNRFAYTSADARAERQNPTKLDIDADKLLAHIRWYRTHLTDYARFKGGLPDGDWEGPNDEGQQELTDELVEEVVGKTFALEKDLQTALRANLGQLEEGLSIADGGSERRVEAGFIAFSRVTVRTF